MICQECKDRNHGVCEDVVRGTTKPSCCCQHKDVVDDGVVFSGKVSGKFVNTSKVGKAKKKKQSKP